MALQVKTGNPIRSTPAKGVDGIINQIARAAAVALLLCLGTVAAQVKQKALRSPAPGVLCDPYICASDKGISLSLTATYLGNKAAAELSRQGPFDMTAFTFANGIFCDVKERLCRENRYYGTNGKHSGAVSTKYTNLLFGE